ncbi:T9SS type B sorting domain-containing protein [Dyadobacter pollutisoli]|uniref:Gliding motility-associated C-terminal domain-containing protein n=1 Tax=Dyadobacter pollutisoli TaxID=2910158 RepID=A0A9E8SL01_9BACT|nr:gliding motility-associated C-terminal domain-containing protein [Dyadobacter pollutisoli]WAC12498.1 gliding motility-associated C-terminal domain-containing protein [Dyadobacter pollutisoli]
MNTLLLRVTFIIIALIAAFPARGANLLRDKIDMACEPSITNIAVTKANCEKDNGVISVTAKGEGPLVYSLDGDSFQSSPVFSGLYAKTYRLLVKSGQGCVVTRDVVVEKLWKPSFVTAVILNPCEFEDKDFGATAMGGYGPITYALDDGPFQEMGFFPDLPGGEYTLRARDSVGCEIVMEIKIPEKKEGVVMQDADVLHARCGGEFGSVTLAATGGSKLQYSLDGQNYGPSPNFPRVPPGAYEVFVKDERGCTDSRNIVIGKSSAPQFLEIIETNASCKGDDGTVAIYAIGSGPLSFSIDAVTYLSDTVFTGLTPLVQTVYMRDTAGCDVARSIMIEKDCLEAIYIPTAFSPDSDGKNEVMDMKFLGGALKIRYFRLFNRWGNVIASSASQNVESGYTLWNGIHNGNEVQPGTYPYELMVEFANGFTRVIRNSVLVLR